MTINPHHALPIMAASDACHAARRKMRDADQIEAAALLLRAGVLIAEALASIVPDQAETDKGVAS